MNVKKRIGALLPAGILLMLVIATVGACGLPGKVLVAYFWDGDSSDIASFDCKLPNVPQNKDNIEKGKYYPTLPGKYQLTYRFVTSPSAYSITFKLEADETLMGNENAYYNVYMRATSPPSVEKYP
jgi:hypothetical protein